MIGGNGRAMSYIRDRSSHYMPTRGALLLVHRYVHSANVAPISQSKPQTSNLHPSFELRTSLRTSRYTVGWLCVLPVEFSAARRMLDEEYQLDDQILGYGDQNRYVLGRIGEHNIVLNCPAVGTSGLLRATKIACDMKSSFPWIRFVLLVGIGGGVPGKYDIRLGDVVAGTAILPLDDGKKTDYGFVPATKSLPPPIVLLNAVTSLEYHLESKNLSQMIEQIATNTVRGRSVYSRPRVDRLYEATFLHRESCDCTRPDPQHFSGILRRAPRQGDLVYTHQGPIGSVNSVIKDARERDELARRRNILCVEMKAAGVMEFTCCLPIRGISDYADGHKNDDWQPYAALAAAVYAKELLKAMGTAEVARCVVNVAGDALENFISGLVRSASARSAGNSPRSAQQAMENLMEGHDLVEHLLDEPLTNLQQTSTQIEDVQKVQALHGHEARVQKCLKTLGDTVDQQAQKTSDYVTRAEWEELKAQVTENTSRIETLSTATQNTLDTTARLMNGLGDHLNKKELYFVGDLLKSAKEYTSHLTDLRKGLMDRARGQKSLETDIDSPQSSAARPKPPQPPPRKPRLFSSDWSGTRPFSKTDSFPSATPDSVPEADSAPSSASITTPIYKRWQEKFHFREGASSGSSTPSEEPRCKIPAYYRSGHSQEQVTSVISPRLLDSSTTPRGLVTNGFNIPHQSNAVPIPLTPHQLSQPQQIRTSGSPACACPSERPRQLIQFRDQHISSSRHTTGESDLSGTTLGSRSHPKQPPAKEPREELEYTQKPVKDLLSTFETRGIPLSPSRR
ncbi:hypothetical protein BJY01DRAFT_259121 [Aspergillus pseudoustus]|uniref:Nucleoside phosphorylase domain-containing protein n=1 Tax=Aspergillus pseudoustus TaxID=1810923 RepID=A0ABR4J6R7_9EURO